MLPFDIYKVILDFLPILTQIGFAPVCKEWHRHLSNKFGRGYTCEYSHNASYLYTEIITPYAPVDFYWDYAEINVLSIFPYIIRRWLIEYNSEKPLDSARIVWGDNVISRNHDGTFFIREIREGITKAYLCISSENRYGILNILKILRLKFSLKTHFLDPSNLRQLNFQ
jgi:hypothetical protein